MDNSSFWSSKTTPKSRKSSPLGGPGNPGFPGSPGGDYSSRNSSGFWELRPTATWELDFGLQNQ